MMNRREALTAVSVLFGGTILGAEAFLAGCTSPGPAEAPFVGLLSAADVALLDEVGETILPETEDSPGARAARIGEFMNIMVTDCYSPADQQVFQAGLLALTAAVQDQYGRDFAALSAEQRHAFLLTLEAEARADRAARSPGDPGMHYYGMIKQLTLLGYFSSEPGATQALRYVPVPGRYDPCTPYQAGEKAWAT